MASFLSRHSVLWMAMTTMTFLNDFYSTIESLQWLYNTSAQPPHFFGSVIVIKMRSDETLHLGKATATSMTAALSIGIQATPRQIRLTEASHVCLHCHFRPLAWHRLACEISSISTSLSQSDLTNHQQRNIFVVLTLHLLHQLPVMIDIKNICGQYMT